MIKKSVFEEDLVNDMYKIVTGGEKFKAINRLSEAVDCLNSASEILSNYGLTSQADAIIDILYKIANDPHTNGLTSEKMVDNLKDHGTEFNLSDDDILDLDIGLSDDEPDNSDMTFEDEV